MNDVETRHWWRGPDIQEKLMSKRNSPRVLLLSLVIAAIAGLALLPGASAAGELSPKAQPFILVSGHAEHSVEPDEATLGLGVVSQAQKAQDAQNQASEATAAILTAIRTLGVSKDQIQTSALDLTPLHEAPSSGSSGYNQDRPITAYRASASLTISITKLDLVGRILDAAVASGANRVSFLSFGLRDERPARRAALADAARDAEGKARSLAQALNCRLGRILEVDEGGVQIQPRVATGLARAMSSVASASSTSVQPGKVKVAASVTMKVAIAAQLKSLAVPGDAESSRPDGR